MQQRILCLASMMLVLFLMLATLQHAFATTAMIFCNGNMGTVSGLTPSQINGLRSSGFTTMAIFTMTVQTNGDFTFGGSTLCSGGSLYRPDQLWIASEPMPDRAIEHRAD